MARSFFTIIFILTIFFVHAQQSLMLQLQERGEVVVCIEADQLQNIPNIGSFSIDGVRDGKALVYLNQKQYQQFMALNIPFIPEIAPSYLHEAKMAADISDFTSWTSYPTYETYVQFMDSLANANPEYCKLVTIGYSVEGRKILALKISDNVNDDEQEPEFFYSSSMHGDELVGYVLMCRLADYLLNNMDNEQVAQLVNGLEIYINPLANPDGAYASGNSTVNGSTRYNANEVDLNRNFPDIDAETGDHPDGNEWQVENVAMMDFFDQHHFVLSMNIHGGSEVVNYPWDRYQKLHVDDEWYQFISREYADTVHTVDASYMDSFDDGITNGYAWYSITGGRQDYVNYYTHGREVCLELSNTKLPGASNLPTYWQLNKQSFLNYMNQALYGVTGYLTDSAGNEIEGIITVLNHDDDQSYMVSDSSGFYCRFLAEGMYNFQFDAEGYLPVVVQDVVVENYTQTILNVKFTEPVSIKSSDYQLLTVYPVPAAYYLYIGGFTETGTVCIFNVSGKLVLSQGVNTIEVQQLDISSLSAGVYQMIYYQLGTNYSARFIVQ